MGVDVIKLLKRYQRKALYVSGVIASGFLVAVTIFALHSLVNDYIADSYTTFNARKTQLRSALELREGALGIKVMHEESAWASRQIFSPITTAALSERNGRIEFRGNNKFPPLLVYTDAMPKQSLAEFAPYFNISREASYSGGSYSQVLNVTSYFFNPELSFLGVGPISENTSNEVGLGRSGRVASLVQRIVPELEILLKDKLSEGASPYWLKQFIDPFTNESSIRLVQGASYNGALFAVFVESYPLSILSDYLAEARYESASLIVDRNNRIITSSGHGVGVDALNAQIVEASIPLTSDKIQNVRYRDGLFIVRSKITNNGWDLIEAFSWRAIFMDLWPRLVMTSAAMMLAVVCVWTALVLIERKVFRPEYARSQRIEESENLNRTIVLAAPSGLVLLSYITGEVILQNDVVRTYFQASTSEGLSLPNKLIKAYKQFHSKEVALADFELALVLRNGEACDLLVHAVQTKYQGADVLLCSFSDITSRKNIERELKDARVAADAASQAKSLFFATMTHEIRTPLHAILGNLELLENSKLTPEQSSRLHVVTSSSNALLNVLNDVLDFSKIESGQMTVESVHFDLADLARQVVGVFSPIANAKGIDLNCVIDDALAPRYVGDPMRVRQIMMNLVSNAIKFTSIGDVFLEVYLKSDSDDDSPVIIGVIDSGIGISAEMQSRLFEPFTQADSTIARRYGGSGLGLALCMRLANLMGGTIMLKSEQNFGSTFMVQLPLQTDPTIKASDEIFPGAQDFKYSPEICEVLPVAARILVVDDQLANRELLKLQLETLGYESDQAADGGAAMELFVENHYDLVLTDLNMPEMDGYKLAHCLRLQNSTVPIIAVTAYITEKEQRSCKDVGINTVLIKPVLLGVLEKTIRGVVKSAPARTDGAATKSDIAQGPLPVRVYDALCRSLESSLTAIRSAANVGEMDCVGGHLHSLRGSFALIHEADLAGICAKIEEKVRGNDFSGLAEELDNFESLAIEALARRSGSGSGSDC